MSTEGDSTKKWKPGIYRKYSSIFKARTDSSAYEQFVPYANYIIHHFLPGDKSAHIVDLGCGIGGFTRAIANAGYLNIQGVDISEESIQTALSQGVQNVVLGDIFSYLDSIPDATIDAILCIDVLEHFTREESVKLLVGIRRVLKPEGRVIIHVPNAEGIFGSKIRYADFTHEMAYTQKSIAQILHYCRFERVSCYEDKPLVHGIISAIRRLLWILLTIPYRVLHAVETGSMDVKLSQNILAMAFKDPHDFD